MKQIVPIAREGWSVVLPVVVAAGAAAILGYLLPAAFLLATALGTALFFRDPKRELPHSPAGILSPADGKVMSIDVVDEGDYLKTTTQRISIFMSLFDVHINYAPVAGQVQYLKYQKGTFRRANLPQASLSNENNSIGIEGNGPPVMIRQIAGTIARRIVCRAALNDSLQAGQKIGLIKFGSRVDLFIPADCEILVTEGQRVKGAISQIARIG